MQETRHVLEVAQVTRLSLQDRDRFVAALDDVHGTPNAGLKATAQLRPTGERILAYRPSPLTEVLCGLFAASPLGLRETANLPGHRVPRLRAIFRTIACRCN